MMERFGAAVVVAAALLLSSAHATPEYLGCARPMTAGSTIMGTKVVESAATSAKLAKGGAAIACGGEITGGQTGLIFDVSGLGKQYIIEAIASDGNGTSWGITDGTCDKQRIVNDKGKTYTVPATGTVTVRTSWADSGGQVTVSPDCKYTVVTPSSAHGSAGRGAAVMALVVSVLSIAGHSHTA